MRMTSTTRPWLGWGLGGVVSALALTPPAQAAVPLDPPRQYRAGGEGTMLVRGPGCCGDTRFTGRFEAIYQIDSAANVLLTRLRLDLDDTDIVVHGGFLDLFSERITLRCGGMHTAVPAPGRYDGGSGVAFAPGALQLAGLSSETRLPDGACGDMTLQLDAANDTGISFLHDPAGDRFALGGTVRAIIGGDTYLITLQLGGHFTNRPPQARALLVTPVFTQGACPAFSRWNGQQWELVAQANDPSGFVGAPYSGSGDPDGAWLHGDVQSERWFRWRDGGDRLYAGDGTLLPPLTFEWGPVHSLELLATDHAGASSASVCRFRVIDTVPPVVTPPPATTVACSQFGGASAASSTPLRGFLYGASATDVADPAPLALPRQVGGVDVTDTTLFATGTTSTVLFRFRDRSGNLGSASSTVQVVDTTPPTVGLTLSPASLFVDYKFHWITATLTTNDACGPVTLRLVSITSNAPAFDAGDILDASYGTDDRGFYLFARPAPGGARIYKVTYEGRDPAGNVRTVTAKVVVG
jgi:hypothetical protein